MTVLPLTRRPGGLQAYKLVIPPHWPPREPQRQVHEGYEWLYLLSGRLRLLLGERDILLRPEEVVEFDTHVPHALSNPHAEPVEVLTLFGPQGERMHLRSGS
jgi:quercetin dioxygenase-like cupin family protein